MILLRLLGIISLFFMFSCQSESTLEKSNKVISESTSFNSETNPTQKLNISIFLDLSDRISPNKHPNPTMAYHERDINNIGIIADAMMKSVVGKPMVLIDDKIKVFVDPAPKDPEVNATLGKCSTHLNRKNVSRDLIENIPSTLKENASFLYNKTIDDNSYIGSDIYSFFKNKVKNLCIEEGKRNLLIILTDGFLYHEDNVIREGNRFSYLTNPSNIGLKGSDWKSVMESKDYGYIKATDNLNNLEVLVLGINGYNNTPYTEDIQKAFLGKWFDEMGVSRYEIYSTDLPVNTTPLIERFILNQ